MTRNIERLVLVIIAAIVSAIGHHLKDMLAVEEPALPAPSAEVVADMIEAIADTDSDGGAK